MTDVSLPPGTTTISALARDIQASLRDAFPGRTWVVGEVDGIERALSKNHWFFNLCESDGGDGKRYSLGATIWQSEKRRMFGPGGTLSGVIEPKDGIEIRALVSVDFYPPYGTLRLIVHDIDAAFTLGKIALERQQLIEKLKKEGVLELQKRHALPDVPLNIGLISSEDSAAYNDFVHELEVSGLSFRVSFIDARMQGQDTVRTVSAALRTLEARGVDAIALVRGGGSTLDLAWFDKEQLVRTIAQLRVPVLTGIGHEIDLSVSDMAANRYFKTPTATAAFLCERGHEMLRFLEDGVRTLVTARDRVRDDARAVAETAAGLKRVIGSLVREQQVDLSGALRRLLHVGPRVAGDVHRSVLQLRDRILSVPARAGLEQRAAWLLERRQGLRIGSGHCLALMSRHVEGLAARARLLDPRNVLRRGYAIVRTRPDGRRNRSAVIKDAAAVTNGQRILAELRDGIIAARVEDSKA